METMQGLKRTDMCGNLTKADAGREVTLFGWAAKNRLLGQLIFLTLRDRTGIVQVAFNDETARDVFEKAEKVRSEYVVAVRGKVSLRTPENINKDMKTGEIEIIAEEIRILNDAQTLFKKLNYVKCALAVNFLTA